MAAAAGHQYTLDPLSITSFDEILSRVIGIEVGSKIGDSCVRIRKKMLCSPLRLFWNLGMLELRGGKDRMWNSDEIDDFFKFVDYCVTEDIKGIGGPEWAEDDYFIYVGNI